MAIPDFQVFLLPLLRFSSDGKEHSLHEAREALAKEFNISERGRDVLKESPPRIDAKFLEQFPDYFIEE